MLQLVPKQARPAPLVQPRTESTATRVQALTEDVLAWLTRLDRTEPTLVDWFVRRIARYDTERDRSREEGLTATLQPASTGSTPN